MAMADLKIYGENKILSLASAVFIIVSCLVVYMPATKGGFIWDDDAMLTNSIILQKDGLCKCWFTTKQPNYWPMTWTSYWLEHKLWGLNPAGYHVVNVLIHAACAVLIWRILIQLNVPGAFAAALIFAVHPVNVESAAWIAQRKTILAMLFFLLSLFCYLRFDRAGKKIFYALSVTLFILAMLSKGSVVGMPVVILLCVWWLKGTIGKRDIFRSIPFFAVSAAMSIVELWFQYKHSIGPVEVRSDSFFSRLAGAGWAVWFYLYKAVLPINLTFIYPRWKIDPANLISYIPGLLLIVLLMLAWRYRRDRGRAVFFALSFYIVMLFPVLGFFNIYFMRYSFVADHYQYVACIGPIALIVALGYRATAKVRLLTAAAAVILAVMGTVTWRQCHIYRNAEILWRDTLAKNPNCWIAHNNLGLMLQSTGKYEEAQNHYLQSLQIQPDNAEAHNNMGAILGIQDKLDAAIIHLRKSLELQPDFPTAHSNLGLALAKKKEYEEAIWHFREALKLNPNDADSRYNLSVTISLDREKERKLPVKPGDK